MAERADPAPAQSEVATTTDRLFDGRLTLRQPAKGHRFGTDAVLLAAAAPTGFTGSALDIGAGVGAAGLALAALAPAACVTLVERDAQAARLAQENVVANGVGTRVNVVPCDLFAVRDRFPKLAGADLVITNPPFHEAVRTRASPDHGRRSAHVLDPDVSLADWLRACLDLLAGGGTLIVIHAPAAVPDMLDVLRGRAGAVTLKGVHPRAGVPAGRVLVRAVKGSRAPFAVAAPLELHTDRAFTPAAERLHRGEGSLDW